MKPIEVGVENIPEGWRPVVMAKDQPQYIPLPALRHDDGRILSRWTFTDEEREAIADGADLYLTVHTFNHALQPLRPDVGEHPTFD